MASNSHLISNVIEAKQKQIVYKDLLDKAKPNDNFDSEIQLNNALKDFKNKIEKAVIDIDRIIYNIYDLSEDDIRIIENS